MLLCVRWYVAYSLSLRNLEEMLAERDIDVDHSTVHRWVIKLVPLFEKTFRKYKRPVGKSWRVDETYIKVKGSWKYLYRAVDKAGNTIDFLFRARRDMPAARRFFEKAIGQNGLPETVTIDKSGSNLAALNAVNAEREMPIKVRQVKSHIAFAYPACVNATEPLSQFWQPALYRSIAIATKPDDASKWYAFAMFKRLQ